MKYTLMPTVTSSSALRHLAINIWSRLFGLNVLRLSAGWSAYWGH